MVEIKTKKEWEKYMKELREVYEEVKDTVVLRPFDKSFGIDEEEDEKEE